MWEIVEMWDNKKEKLAVVVSATRDVSGSVPIELKSDEWEIILMDPFELFFKSPAKAKLHYEDIFKEIKEYLWEDEESTKLTVESHSTNIDDIREWKTDIFRILVKINENEEERVFTIGTLVSLDSVKERLKNKKVKNIEKYWLEGIQNSDKWDGFDQIFQVWIGWGTHNVASTMWSLLGAIKSDVLQVFTPNNSNKNDDNYTLRTSLLCHVDWLKICIRTEPEIEKIYEIEQEVEKNKSLIKWIITTRPDNQENKEYDIHAIPSHFDSNITKKITTLVFNWEDREVWEVISRVIDETESFLNSQNNLKIKVKLYNLLIDLKNREERLKDINEVFSIEWEWFKDVKKTLNKHKWTTHKRSGRSLEALNSFLKKEKSTMLDMIIARRFILKDILKYIVMINEIITDFNCIKWDTGKIMMITDWELWSVWVINTSWYEIFFENLILEIWNREKDLFNYLKNITSWIIDVDIQDTTWCGDSSITACMMMREDNVYQIRKKSYVHFFEILKIDEQDYDKAIAISESFFMSTLQKIISWTVYHCRRSNLWDIPNSKKVSAILLKYTFWKTLKYIQDWEKWILKHLYSQDDWSSSKEKKYKWFNTYMVTKK